MDLGTAVKELAALDYTIVEYDRDSLTIVGSHDYVPARITLHVFLGMLHEGWFAEHIVDRLTPYLERSDFPRHAVAAARLPPQEP